MLTIVNQCNYATNATKRQPLKRLTNDSFESEMKCLAKKKIEKNSCITREKRDVVVILVITWSLYWSLSRLRAV